MFLKIKISTFLLHFVRKYLTWEYKILTLNYTRCENIPHPKRQHGGLYKGVFRVKSI